MSWYVAMVAALSIGLVACAGAGNGDGAKIASTGAKPLSDCEYAKVINDALTGFSKAIETPDDAADAKIFDTIDAQLAKTVADLKGLTVAKDVEPVNNGFIIALEDFRKEIPEVKKAFDAGDVDKAGSLIETAVKNLGDAGNKIDEQNRGVSRRLDACPKA